MRHARTDDVFAVKMIRLGVEVEVRQRIIKELQILHDCGSCPHIVTFHEACWWDGAVCIVLEYMDSGALDSIYRKTGPLIEAVVANVAFHVASGLDFLHKKHLIHRDTKPSNILTHTSGPVKIADFGVSGELANSLAETASWCGTATYMSPERIQGDAYSYDSDVWALGLSVMECALGRFPYSQQSEDPSAQFWDILHQIVQKPVPELPKGFSVDFESFVTLCLKKQTSARPSTSVLLEHPFLKLAADDHFVSEWIASHKGTSEASEVVSPKSSKTSIRDHGLG